MPRSLRTRKSTINYANLFVEEEDVDPSASRQVVVEDDPGSDFAAEVVQDGNSSPAEVDDEEYVEADGGDDYDDAESSLTSLSEDDINATTGTTNRTTPKTSKILSKKGDNKKVKGNQHSRTLTGGDGANAIYNKQGKIERLKGPAQPFNPTTVKITNGWDAQDKISKRFNKAWAWNVGPGPLWNLMEDKAFYKEAACQDSGSETVRRPLVYPDIKLKDDLEILSEEQAARYVSPGGTPDNFLVRCSFGPFGKQTAVALKRYESTNLESYFPTGGGLVFNAGSPVWGIDWCPIYINDRPKELFKQYLAVAPLPSPDFKLEVGKAKQGINQACIQIWSLNPPVASNVGENDAMDVDQKNGFMRCEMVVCIQCGPAHDIKWCPLPSHDSLDVGNTNQKPRKLGLLAGTFDDGSLSIFAIPHPDDIRSMSPTTTSGVTYVRLPEPLVRIEVEGTTCWSFDWANSETVAVGCANGHIAVYNIVAALQAESTPEPNPLLPLYYIQAHQSAIRSLAWVRAPTYSGEGKETADDPTYIISGGYEGSTNVTDLREPCGYEMHRTREVVNSVCYAPWGGGLVGLDQDCIRAISFAAIDRQGHKIHDYESPILHLNASDYHPHVAIAGADGSLSTSNIMRATRKANTVPYFVHKIYQLDYNRKTGEYRMLERFLPKEVERVTAPPPPGEDPADNTRRKHGGGKHAELGFGVWPTEVGVNRAAWNNGNGLNSAPLLASATSSGLCRVDWLEGRWYRNKIPYRNLRGEPGLEGSEDEMDVANE